MKAAPGGGGGEILLAAGDSFSSVGGSVRIYGGNPNGIVTIEGGGSGTTLGSVYLQGNNGF